MTLDKNSETFIIHVASFNLKIYLDREAQIAFLLTEEFKILEEYLDFTNVFLEKKALVLPKRNKLNKYSINLENGKQQLYRPIYSLDLIELETLKTYIKTYLKTGFIWPSKSPASASIPFDKKLDGSFCLCIDYRGLNNFIIKN